MKRGHWRLLEYIRGKRRKFGFSSLACLNFHSPPFDEFLERVGAFYLAPQTLAWPDYLHNTKRQRMDPRFSRPWVNAALIFALPARRIPEKTPFIPLTDDHEKSGLIAGYGGRIDYHLRGRQLLEEVIEAVRGHLRSDARFEVCVDTKPLAERALAAAAGLGQVGRNSCLLCANEGSGCFILSLLTDLDLPNYESEKVPDYCQSCDHCVKRCPNNVIGDSPTAFNCVACRSHLTMNKRGELSQSEREQLGDWIFGCDLCSGVCPESKLPPTLRVDLEWLLCAPSSNVKRAIAQTPLDFAGVQLLRRNALYVLAQRRTSSAMSAIKTFASGTRSDFLRKIAKKLLEEQR